MVPTPTRVLTTTAHSMDYLTANTKLECLQIWRIPKMLRCDLKFRQLLTVDNELLQYHEYYIVRDINSPIHFHQSTNIFLTKFGVMIILMMLWNAFWCSLEI